MHTGMTRQKTMHDITTTDGKGGDKVYITVHLSDGRKIIKEDDKLRFFIPKNDVSITTSWQYGQMIVPTVNEGIITINMNHIVDMRPAEPEEIQRAVNQGW